MFARNPEAAGSTMQLLQGRHRGSPKALRVLLSRTAAVCFGITLLATPIAQTLSEVQNLVAQNPLVIFSKTYCPFCRKVKQLFAEVGARRTVVELDEEADGSSIQNALTSWTGQRTVPNVFIGGNHIGGCDDTVALQEQGKLWPLLKAAGAVQEEAQAA